MRKLPPRLRPNLRLRVGLAGATILLLAGTTGVFGVVDLFIQNGPFTGCLGSKSGVIYNVAQAGAPLDECSTGDKVVRFSNAQGPQGLPGRNGDTGAPGVPGAPGAAGTNGTNGAPGVSESFWSGVTNVTTPAARDQVVNFSLAATGPIPPSWWTITGQLTLSGSGDVFVGCNLLASSGAQLAPLYTTAAITSPVSIPIRVLVDQSASPTAQIAEIQCTVVGGPFGGGPFGGGNVVATADLLVLPTERGQIGVAP